MDPGVTLGLLVATFTASFVEFVEALPIVLAMGATRSWRSALSGVVAAVVALAGFTAAAGYALTTWLPEALLQLVVGSLLLVFGLQWLRKAILRSSGLLASHDEEAAFASQTAAAAAAGSGTRLGLDWFAFVVSFKGVFLEGVEVVFIVITFGLNAGSVPVAAVGAAAAGLAARWPSSACWRPGCCSAAGWCACCPGCVAGAPARRPSPRRRRREPAQGLRPLLVRLRDRRRLEDRRRRCGGAAGRRRAGRRRRAPPGGHRRPDRGCPARRLLRRHGDRRPPPLTRSGRRTGALLRQAAGLGPQHVEQQRGGPAEVVAAVALGAEGIVVLPEAGVFDQPDDARLDLARQLRLAVLPQPAPDQPVGVDPHRPAPVAAPVEAAAAQVVAGDQEG